MEKLKSENGERSRKSRFVKSRPGHRECSKAAIIVEHFLVFRTFLEREINRRGIIRANLVNRFHVCNIQFCTM